MHEAVVVDAILEVALSEAALRGARAVTRLRVTVGVRSGISADSLRAAFAETARGTLAGGAALEITEGAGSGWTLDSVRVA